MHRHRDIDDASPMLERLRQRFPMTPQIHGQHFFVRENGKLIATPLFAALIAVDLADVIFAVDSIPAILAVTNEPFLVYTSNAFAILGLRAMYFFLAVMIRRFEYLNVGLVFILAFVGVKMMIVDLGEDPDLGLPQRHRRDPGGVGAVLHLDAPGREAGGGGRLRR